MEFKGNETYIAQYESEAQALRLQLQELLN